MALMNAAGSAAFDDPVPPCKAVAVSLEGLGPGTSAERTGVGEDHFHPGVALGSSSKDKIRSADEFTLASGRRSRVIENPGMLRLV